ncbi:MAG: endonuclease/exonuclease/phosphatase [Planctomycetales bacterium]|nr:endonuclease/exonuclease/phosphatase [Planctomycetales bacterium]NIM08094.1 endonuclease/exonuclease/phosphatase [Planctomycetales bacterium]NIN07585.1 endonuclease/exonuclease/phosphatase [Planctomycetales bacterium]NIN76693.1 endonuclease/exonuclease/phosphatase [Planctomycetales bacterium]NIO33882.1 endonuclease/exonuclease/phosphatase [Planctomycetales bacterium]
MRRMLALLLFLGIAVGVVLFHLVFQIEGLDKVFIRRRPLSPFARQAASGQEGWGASRERVQDTIRIGSYNIEVFGPQKASQPHVMDVIARTVRQFDLLAIQEIRSKDQSLIPQLVRQVNTSGAHYGYLLGPRLGRTHSKEQYAYLFNTKTIDVDREATYTISDPHDRMHREPFVALFRARGPDPKEAFTFKLVNVHVDPDVVDEELNALDDVYYAVLNDGDEEDDVVLLGDFNTSEQRMHQLGSVPEMTVALTGITTNSLGTAAYDNLVFHRRNTIEFVGRSGVLDLVRVFNLTSQQVQEVSDHLPIWADFSIFEGGGRGRVAARPPSNSAQ